MSTRSIATIEIQYFVHNLAGVDLITPTLKPSLPVCASCGGHGWVHMSDPDACHYQAPCPVCNPIPFTDDAETNDNDFGIEF